MRIALLIVCLAVACAGRKPSTLVDGGHPEVSDSDAGTSIDAGSIEDGGTDSPDGGLADDAGSELPDGGGEVTDAGAPSTPAQIFGSRYWNVYRPAFFASFYVDGHVTDRIENGAPAFGDGTIWMAYLLSTMVYEYRAAHLDDSLRVISEILTAYDALDGLWGDPVDGYVYRADRGPDFTFNWLSVPNLCPPPNGLCFNQCYGLRDDEPSGDQMFGTLRALRDLVEAPGELRWNGVDLKQKARDRATLMGTYLKNARFQMTNKCNDAVKRGPDQRWAAWTFEQAAALVSGAPRSTFERSWDLGGVAIGPENHHDVAKWFVAGCWKFSSSCMGGQSVSVAGIPVNVACNEFNVGLGGDAAVMSLSDDPTSPDWFSKWVDTADIEAEGNALYALYARYRFHNPDERLVAVGRKFLDAPATPPNGDTHDPGGWCVTWRWGHDYSDPHRCDTGHPGQTFTGLDYMLPRAMASAYGEFPE